MIVVGGECLIDLVLGPGGELTAHPGGGPYNVARALGRLGVPTAFVGAVSTDAFGRRLRAELDAAGVELRWAVSTELPTTLALAEPGPDGAAYRFYFERTAAPALDDTRAVPVPRALHVGSLGLVLEPMAGALEALVERVAGEAVVMVDANWRPAAISDHAAQRDRLLRVLVQADVVKVSTEDLEHLGIEPAALLRGRTRCVLVTDGPRAVRALRPGGELAVDVPAAKPVDTVGAGDAFGAGFLGWWVEREAGADALEDGGLVREAVRFGVRVATITCSRAGADPPWRAELGGATTAR